MKKTVFVILAMALVPFGAFAVDGVVLINQATVMAAGNFPYTISAAGSYKLSSNLNVPSGVDGIKIAASNVTLDLNGFSIANVDPNNSNNFLLLKLTGTVVGVTIRNGILSTAASSLFNFFGASGTVFEDLTLVQPPGGSVFTGVAAIVRRVSFEPGRHLFRHLSCARGGQPSQ